VRTKLVPHCDESPHDRDVDGDGTLAPEDTRQHRDALLGEDEGRRSSSTI
jgi:hypothetical protein